MKFRVGFKTPDALDDVLSDHMDTHCEVHEEHDPDCDKCYDLECKGCDKIAEIKKCSEKFVRFNEYVTIEFDTETGTATVVPVK